MRPRRRELLVAALALPAAGQAAEPDLARRLAGFYPVNPSLGYVTALILSSQRQLNDGRLPAHSQQVLLTLREAAPATPPLEWPLRAGYAAFAEAALHDGDAHTGTLALQALRSAIVDTPDGPRLVGLRSWTDDLFMAALLFERTLPLLPATEQPRALAALVASLLDLSSQLQRPDGLFNHALSSPIAWGRGNGFASLGLALALAGPLASNAPLLERLNSHLRALLPLQGPDGLWRQVLDHAAAPPELTATAMSLAALAIARRQRWLGGPEVDAAIARAWAAVQGRVDADGGFHGACAGTPAGPSLDFYLQRPILNGRDDRAAAMLLQALRSRP